MLLVIILIILLALVSVYLWWQVLGLKAELAKTHDAIKIHWTLQYNWSDFVHGDLIKLCNAIQHSDTTVDCTMYAGKSPPTQPDYP